MHSVIQLQTTALFFNNISWSLIVKGLLLVLATFFFVFLMIRTLERENIYKFDLKSMARKLKFIKYTNAVLLVKDGVLQLNQLHIASVSPQQVYEAMRRSNVNNLAQIERLFLVTGGEFSIYKKEDIPAEVPVFQYLPKELADKQGKA